VGALRGDATQAQQKLKESNLHKNAAPGKSRKSSTKAWSSKRRWFKGKRTIHGGGGLQELRHGRMDLKKRGSYSSEVKVGVKYESRKWRKD